MQQILNDINTYLTTQSELWPHKSNWASQLGDICQRRLVYYRTDWDKQKQPDARLQGIFNTGSQLEDIVSNNLNRVGQAAEPKWQIVEAEALKDSLLIKANIGGVPDKRLKVWGNGKPEIKGIVEMKSMSPFYYGSINTIEDIKKHKFYAKYYTQVQIYLLGAGFEKGWLLLYNKSNLWDIKFIEVELDYAYAENLIQKSEYINKCVDNNEKPEKISDPNECPDCPFVHICKPDYATGGNCKIINDDELYAALKRLSELADTKKEIKDLEKVRDGMLEKGQDLICGEYIITWKHITKNNKAREASVTEEYRKKIIFTGS